MTTEATPADERPSESLTFPLQDGEAVLNVVRRHWLYLFPRLALLAILTIVPPILMAWLLSEVGAPDGAGRTIFLIVAALWVLYWAARLFLTWYSYNNDVWVITNQRIIDSRKTTPFSLQLSSADLVNVQDMTVERSGVLRTIFDFGDIICRTASDQSVFRLSGIPDPRSVQAQVDRERDRERLRYRA